jgi:hypothetical protein
VKHTFEAKIAAGELAEQPVDEISVRYVTNQIDQLSRGPGAPDLVKKTPTENYAAW